MKKKILSIQIFHSAYGYSTDCHQSLWVRSGPGMIKFKGSHGFKCIAIVFNRCVTTQVFAVCICICIYPQSSKQPTLYSITMYFKTKNLMKNVLCTNEYCVLYICILYTILCSVHHDAISATIVINDLNILLQ